MTGDVLFRETISAWDLGPVVGELWKADKAGSTSPGSVPIADESALNTVGYVVSRYGGLAARDLVTLTHGEQPWQLANQGRLPGTSARMSVESIRDYFVESAAEPGPDEPAVMLDTSVVRKWLSTVRTEPDPAAPAETDESLRLSAGLAG